MITADQIVAHLVGDYILQSDWMATEKTQRSGPALVHALCYSLPFLFLSLSPQALIFIAGTHFLIDRFRLARYVVWLKNFVGPRIGGCFGANIPWAYCRATGYPPDRPVWLTTWLLIIADNTLHLICNGLALRWL